MWRGFPTTKFTFQISDEIIVLLYLGLSELSDTQLIVEPEQDMGYWLLSKQALSKPLNAECFGREHQLSTSTILVHTWW